MALASEASLAGCRTRRTVNAFRMLIFIAFFFVLVIGDDDLYKILGVPRGATKKQIRTAYHKLARSEHPDKKPGDPNADQKFAKIVHANDILSDVEKRDRYDRFGDQSEADPERDPGGRGGFGGAPFFFNPGFGFGGGGPNFKFSFGGGGFPGQQGPPRPPPPPRRPFKDSKVIEADESSFDSLVFDDPFLWPTLVLFYGNELSRESANDYKDVASHFSGIVKLLAINTLEQPRFSQKMGVRRNGLALRLYFSYRDHPFSEYSSRVFSTEKISTWLSKALPSFAVVLTPSNMEDYLTARSTLAKVILFTDKPSVPPIFKHLSSRFEKQIATAIVFKSSEELVNKFTAAGGHSNPIPPLPAMLHLTDVDNLTGNWESVSNDINVLSLMLSRISHQKRHSTGLYASQHLPHKLTRRRLQSGECDVGDYKTCLLLLAAVSRHAPKKHLDVFATVAEAYRNEPYHFVWIDPFVEHEVTTAFGLDQASLLPSAGADGIAELWPTTVVAYRPKRAKFGVLSVQSDEESEVQESVSNFIENLIASGGSNLKSTLSKQFRLPLLTGPIHDEL